MADIMTPALGESVTEATVARWTKKAGDAVRRDEVLVELETDKVSLEVVAPEDGVLTSIGAEEGATVIPGTVLGVVTAGGAAAAKPAAKPAAAPAPAAKAEPATAPAQPAQAAPAARWYCTGQGEAASAPPSSASAAWCGQRGSSSRARARAIMSALPSSRIASAWCAPAIMPTVMTVKLGQRRLTISAKAT